MSTSSAAHGVGREGPPPEGAWSKRFQWGFNKSIKISDWVSPYANAVSAKVGGERFWPQSNDMPIEIEKCERILRSFTVEGVPQKEEKEEKVQDGKGNWITKKRKVLKKIPPSAIKAAKGICIYSSMRSGLAPFGGGGGAGMVLARLPDGSWSAPSAITPQNASAGLLLGIDFLDVVLLLNSEKALQSFLNHKVTVGAETGLTAGPWGAGTSAEAGIERAPIYSYVRTRGAFAGLEIMGQVFLHRFDENERFYYWPGVSPVDILTGKVRMPPLVSPLHRALRDAELGVAQGGKLERVVYDIVKMPESEVMKMLGPGEGKKSKRFVAGSSATPSTVSTPMISTPREEDGEEKEVLKDLDESDFTKKDEEEDDLVREGEKLRLPPTPEELEMLERAGIPDEEDLKFQQIERENVYKLPPPPMHFKVQKYWRIRPELAGKRPTHQLTMDGRRPAEMREAQLTPLPPSPRSSLELRMEAEAKAQAKEDEARWEAKRKMFDTPTEKGVLLQEIDEEEADKVMKAAAEGEDVQQMKDSGEMDQMVNESKEERGEEQEQEEATMTAKATTGIADKAKEVVVEASEEGTNQSNFGSDGVEAPTGNKGQFLEEPSSSSSPRASLNLSNGHTNESSNTNSPRASMSEDGQRLDMTPPSRPPRNRPPRRNKA